jgi:hypothetical protein
MSNCRDARCQISPDLTSMVKEPEKAPQHGCCTLACNRTGAANLGEHKLSNITLT